MNEFWQWFNNSIVSKLDERAETFIKMFEHLDKFKNPIIIETGTLNEPDENGEFCWSGHGCSTLLFDKYITLNGGHLYSVDIDPERVRIARNYINPLVTDIIADDSISFLKNLANTLTEPPHLVYLDSGMWQAGLTEIRAHHFTELKAIFPKLTPDTLVAIDDSPSIFDENDSGFVGGRGSFIAQYANEIRVPLVFSKYQAGWLGFPGKIDPKTVTYTELAATAKNLVIEGKWSEAYPIYKFVLLNIKNPNSDAEAEIYSEACIFFGKMAAKYNRYGTGYDWYQRALIASPNTANRLDMIIHLMKPAGWINQARVEALKAVEDSPNNPEAWCILGDLEGAISNMAGCLYAIDKFIETSNRSISSLIIKTQFLIEAERFDEADALCDEALLSRIHAGDALKCKGLIQAKQGKNEEAIELYNKALAAECTDPSMVKYHLALSLHSVGRCREGWQNLFMSRLENETFIPLYTAMRRFVKPLKQLFVMQPSPATVHVHVDAGEGDNFALMRYLPLLAEKGYTVRYEARPTTIKLAQDSFPEIEVVPLAKDFPGVFGIKDFDYQIPIVDLPFIFQTGIDNIPWNGPYIKADPKLVESYKSHKGKVGLCWSTGPNRGVWRERFAQRKSIRFIELSSLIDVDPSMFVSLQAGLVRTENNRILDCLPFDKQLTWADTAALIENLDLVITIDTSIAHLAGAMGKPTWLMMHAYETSWQFMSEKPGALWNTSSPWYPTMRIFRQKIRGNWQSVIDEVTKELKHVRMESRPAA